MCVASRAYWRLAGEESEEPEMWEEPKKRLEPGWDGPSGASALPPEGRRPGPRPPGGGRGADGSVSRTSLVFVVPGAGASDLAAEDGPGTATCQPILPPTSRAMTAEGLGPYITRRECRAKDWFGPLPGSSLVPYLAKSLLDRHLGNMREIADIAVTVCVRSAWRQQFLGRSS